MTPIIGTPTAYKSPLKARNLFITASLLASFLMMSPIAQNQSLHIKASPNSQTHQHAIEQPTHQGTTLLKQDIDQDKSLLAFEKISEKSKTSTEINHPPIPNADELPSLASVQKIAEDVLQELQPVVSVPMSVKLDPDSKFGLLSMYATPKVCQLVINPSPEAWQTWSYFNNPSTEPINSKTQKNAQEAFVKMAVAHEVGHCASYNPATAFDPQKQSTLSKLFMNKQTPFEKTLKMSTLEQEKIADLFASTYALQYLPKAQSTQALSALYQFRKNFADVDVSHDTTAYLHQRSERFSELGQVAIPIEQLSQAVQQMHEQPEQSLLNTYAKKQIDQEPSKPDASQQALANLPSISQQAANLAQKRTLDDLLPSSTGPLRKKKM